MQIDNIDKKLLDIIQNQFPLSAEPYIDIASLLDISEEDVITRLKKLKDEKVIRRMGAIFDSKQLGYSSSLCAMKVPSHQIDEVAKIINEYSGVTHNYLRDNEYNMWFTITARSQSGIEDIISEIKDKSGIQSLINLPSVRTFKIEVKFSMSDEGNFSATKTARQISQATLTEYEREIVKIIQKDIPLCHSPFKAIASELGTEDADLISKLKEMNDHGIIRRFGAILRHRSVGISANAMGVWCVPEEKIESTGAVMATFSQVSHCYQRVTSPDWRYNVYTMIHGKTTSDCEQVARDISQRTGITDCQLLYSRRELKKSTMIYFTEKG
jgi:DNA-binding Lrp family transcriptional regulator